jgi:hypothetical protein
MAKAYDCITKAGCDETAQGACSDGLVSTFGDELCAVLLEKQVDCGGVEAFNLQGAWLRDDVKKAAFDCARLLSTADVLACVRAWSEAVPL